jgi:alanine racemase
LDVATTYTITEIARITKGKIIGEGAASQPLHLLLDSRKLLYPAETIFFSLSSKHINAVEIINSLYKKGVRFFVVDDKSFIVNDFSKATFILVDEAVNALQTLASHHQTNFNITTIGITGSNGKTIVKEWLNQLLQHDYDIVRSPKSYNSQIGVPLSILQIRKENTLALFEAGISEPGEMGKLETMIQPEIGILTNIGEAHNEGFTNKKEKIKEKLLLFKSSENLIFCNDDDAINEEVNILQQYNSSLKLFSWSRKNQSTLKILSVEKENYKSLISAEFSSEKIDIEISFTDDASIENAITCWCVLLHFKIDNEIISKRMLELHSLEMRLELKQGINNCSIINDSYSADINSLKIALAFLHQQKQHKKQTVIISDILQTGKTETNLYHDIAFLLKQKNINRLLAIGPVISSQQKQFNFLQEKHFFDSVEDFKQQFNTLHFQNESILVKGARVFQFEQITELLEQKVHQTILSINLNSIAHNLKQYKSLLKPSVKIMAVVKAFSYGSGSYQIANLLQFNNVDYLAVAYADEGVELRKAGITIPIMVMNAAENTFNALVQNNLEPEIFSFSILFAFEKYLDKLGLQNFPVHIKIDTGMHRLGFEKHEIESLAEHLTNNKKLKVQSVFSHLAASDTDKDFTAKQASIFLEACHQIQKVLSYNFIKHLANTSGINKHPDLQLDMVRLGIGLYGIDSNPSIQKKLLNISTLSTTIAQIKKVKAGERVGYGSEAVVDKDLVIATVRIGYADGYPRALSNGIGKMLVKNKAVDVVGKVCMDMTMLDVTGIDCREGDIVIVFGEHLPVHQLAKWCNTIPYEIMTGISQRVNRVYFE